MWYNQGNSNILRQTEILRNISDKDIVFIRDK